MLPQLMTNSAVGHGLAWGQTRRQGLQVRRKGDQFGWTLDGRHLIHRSACAGTLLHHAHSSHVALLLLRDLLHELQTLEELRRGWQN